MSFPRDRVVAALDAEIDAAQPLGGGSIATVWRVRLTDGDVVVVKTGRRLEPEAWMLRWLARETRAPVPAVHHAEDDLLIMEHLDGRPGLAAATAETALAEVVAGLHARSAPSFGFERDTVIGGLPQPNRPHADWLRFFRDERLLFMARGALAAGRLSTDMMMRIERIAGRLERWLPPESTPALIHGDLWHGNILSQGDRIVGLLDPALYFADAEIELAFMTLFGSVGERFFSAYREHRPIAAGFFEERRDIYNLYPLLVHVRLFGASYVGQVAATLSRFGY